MLLFFHPILWLPHIFFPFLTWSPPHLIFLCTLLSFDPTIVTHFRNDCDVHISGFLLRGNPSIFIRRLRHIRSWEIYMIHHVWIWTIFRFRFWEIHSFCPWCESFFTFLPKIIQLLSPIFGPSGCILEKQKRWKEEEKMRGKLTILISDPPSSFLFSCGIHNLLNEKSLSPPPHFSRWNSMYAFYNIHWLQSSLWWSMSLVAVVGEYLCISSHVDSRDTKYTVQQNIRISRLPLFSSSAVPFISFDILSSGKIRITSSEYTPSLEFSLFSFSSNISRKGKL